MGSVSFNDRQSSGATTKLEYTATPFRIGQSAKEKNLFDYITTVIKNRGKHYKIFGNSKTVKYY